MTHAAMRVRAAGSAAALAAAMAVLVGAAPSPAAAQKMESCRVGQRVKTPGGLLATVVAAKGAGCTIKTDVGNTFIDGVFSAFMLTPVAGSPVAPPPPTPGGGALPLGEYACYGSGGRVMIGLGFKLLPGGRYDDLDGKSPGRYAQSGTTISFAGGHLAGQTGRDVKGKGFRIGAQAVCEKW